MPTSKSQGSETHYTVFIRVPFPRGDFIDPPAVHWDLSKDQALWKILSSSSKGSEIDWHDLADRFDVSLVFLLQQAAWLYERQLSQVREQLRKVSRPTSMGSSPIPPSISSSVTAPGHAVKGGPSGGSRVPSSLSFRTRDSPSLSSDGYNPNIPNQTKAPPMSRTSSTNTVQRAQLHHNPGPKPSRLSLETSPRPSLDPPHSRSPRQPSPSTFASSSSSSSSSHSPPPHLSRSRAFTRRPRYSTTKPPSALGLLSSASDEEDDTPSFLPFSTTRPSHPSHTPAAPTSPSATLRASATKPPSTSKPKRPLPPFTATSNPPQTSTPSPTSSTSASASASASASTSQHPPPTSTSTSNPNRPAALLLSPRQRLLLNQENSDGSPSMGSSFSDLDDASVTQSALEEALVREMGAGGGQSQASFGGVSRIGAVGRVLRRGYL